MHFCFWLRGSFIRNFKHRHQQPGSTKRFLLKLCDKCTLWQRYKFLEKIKSNPFYPFTLKYWHCASKSELRMKGNISFHLLSPHLQLYLYMHRHRGILCTVLKLGYMMVTSKSMEITVLLLPTAFKIFLGLEEKLDNYWIFSVTFKQIHNTSGFLQLHRETKPNFAVLQD